MVLLLLPCSLEAGRDLPSAIHRSRTFRVYPRSLCPGVKITAELKGYCFCVDRETKIPIASLIGHTIEVV